jgi:hypothetical protein
MAAPSGGGALRIGGDRYAVTRVPLPRPPLPDLDLGDIDLGSAIEVSAVLDRDLGCSLQAVGPVGKTGLQIISGVRSGESSFAIALPEPGLWQFGLVCGEGRRGLTPGSVRLTTADHGAELRFKVREK